MGLRSLTGGGERMDPECPLYGSASCYWLDWLLHCARWGIGCAQFFGWKLVMDCNEAVFEEEGLAEGLP